MASRKNDAATRACLVAIAVGPALIAGACAAAPRARPLPTSPIEKGPTTATAARQFLQGRWSLLSYEVYPPARSALQIAGSGTLVYDEFGNLEMQIRVTDQATSAALQGAGIPLNEGVISTTGRAVIDVQRRTLTYILEGQRPLVATAPVDPLAFDRPRYWDVQGNVLTLTTRGNDGQPVAVSRWQKSQ